MKKDPQYQNSAFLRGRLGSDIQIEKTISGEVYGRVSLATSEPLKSASGAEMPSKPTWHEVKIWGKDAAENAQQLHKKGASVEVQGPLQPSSYSTANGERVFTYAVNAVTISPADPKLPSECKLKLTGALQEDISVRQSSEGKSYVNFSVRTAEDYFDKSGTKHERGAFHRIHTTEPNQMENLQVYKKGDMLDIDGKIEKNSFMTQKGRTHSFSIIPSSIELAMNQPEQPKKGIEVRRDGQLVNSPQNQTPTMQGASEIAKAAPKRPGRPAKAKEQEPAQDVPF